MKLSRYWYFLAGKCCRWLGELMGDELLLIRGNKMLDIYASASRKRARVERAEDIAKEEGK